MLMTPHFQRRAQQRAIRQREFDLVLDYGHEYHRNGGLFVVIRRCWDLPPEYRRFWPQLAKIVLLRERQWDGTWGPWLTCYKRNRPLRFIERKPRYRRDQQCPAQLAAPG